MSPALVGAPPRYCHIITTKLTSPYLPGLPVGSCSSARAYKLFVDSIEKKKEYVGLYCEALPKSFDTCLLKKDAMTRKATMGADLKFE